MKNRNNTPLVPPFVKVILLTALTVGLALPLTAQQPHNEISGSAVKVRNVTGTMETSTVVAAIERPHMKLWLMTRKTGVVIARDVSGKLTGLDGETKPVPADRYIIRVDVTDKAILENIGDATASVLVVSPSAENELIEFNSANGGFGCAFTLAEKGEYRFTVRVIAGRVSRLAQFRYAVK